MNADMIRSLTPWFLASISFLIIVVGVCKPALTPEVRLSVLNIASVALGGAAGLSQQNRNPTQIQNSDIERLSVGGREDEVSR